MTNQENDPHTVRAAKMFGVSVEDVTPEQRRKGKAANYIKMYSSPISLKENVKRYPLEHKAKDCVLVTNEIVFKVSMPTTGVTLFYGGTVEEVVEDGVQVSYLCGYWWKHDLIPWKDVIAQKDKRMKEQKLEGTPFTGRYLKFKR